MCHFFPAFSPKIASGKGQLGSLAEIAISLQIKRLVSGPLQLSNCRSDSNPTEHPPVQTVLGTETVRDRGKAKALFTECVLPLAKSGFRSPTSGVEWVSKAGAAFQICPYLKSTRGLEGKKLTDDKHKKRIAGTKVITRCLPDNIKLWPYRG